MSAAKGQKENIGFVFDLDGVIYHSGGKGKAVVPRTAEALTLLEKHNIPYAFVSNGTGYTELQKAQLIEKLLSKECSIKVPREKVFLSATPMRELAIKYGNQRVLVVAGDTKSLEKGTAARVATDLGFKNFVTIEDFTARRPHLLPLTDVQTSEELMAGKSNEPIAACFVFHEPPSWHETLQVLIDVIGCGGQVEQLEPGASRTARTEKVGEEEPSFDVYLTNPDIMYPVQNAPPRFTLGSFGLCLGAMYQRLSTLRPGFCAPLNIHYCGKPFPMVYKSARKYLEAAAAERDQQTEPVKMDAIFMVGGEWPHLVTF